MAGSYKTISSLNTDANSVYATGQGTGAITPARVNQFVLDQIATTAPSESALTYASSLSWPLDTNPVARVTLTGNVTITASAGQDGHAYRLVVLQGGSGSYTVSLAGVTLLGAAVWGTAVGAYNILTVDVSNGVRLAGVV